MGDSYVSVQLFLSQVTHASLIPTPRMNLSQARYSHRPLPHCGMCQRKGQTNSTLRILEPLQRECLNRKAACQPCPADGVTVPVLSPPRVWKTGHRDPAVLVTVVARAWLLWEDFVLYPVVAIPCETHSFLQTPNPGSLECLPTWGPGH